MISLSFLPFLSLHSFLGGFGGLGLAAVRDPWLPRLFLLLRLLRLLRDLDLDLDRCKMRLDSEILANLFESSSMCFKRLSHTASISLPAFSGARLPLSGARTPIRLRATSVALRPGSGPAAGRVLRLVM